MSESKITFLLFFDHYQKFHFFYVIPRLSISYFLLTHKKIMPSNFFSEPAEQTNEQTISFFEIMNN